MNRIVKPIFRATIAAAVVLSASAAEWSVTVGVESPDKGRQALAFLPNEIWIHAGDSITWTFAVDEIHTVSLLQPAQIRPPFAVGCPGTTPNDSSFNGS